MMTDDRTETLTIKKFFHNDPVERYNSYIDSCINEVWGKKEDMVPAKMFRRVFGPAVRLYYSGKRLPPPVPPPAPAPWQSQGAWGERGR